MVLCVSRSRVSNLERDMYREKLSQANCLVWFQEYIKNTILISPILISTEEKQENQK